jgi:GxxExxY protein
VKVEEEVTLDLTYDEMVVLGAYRIDLLVQDTVIVEVKSVDKLHPIHKSQVLTYLKFSRRSIGL